jgi:hypothetical protein
LGVKQGEPAVPRFVAIPLACLLLAVSAGRGHGEVLRYIGYIAGLRMLEIDATFELSDTGYKVETHSTTLGLADLFSHSDHLVEADGGWQGGTALPREYHSLGLWHGEPNDVRIDYPNGMPEVVRLIPKVEGEPLDPVPPALQATGQDGLTVLATVLRDLDRNRSCAGTHNMFDGRHFSRIVAQDGAPAVLGPESRSIFVGPAESCQVEIVPLAGIPVDAGPDDSARKPTHVSAWFARATQSHLMVPVLISAELRLFGHMTLYLSGEGPGELE